MKLYADAPARLIRQGIADVIAMALIAGVVAAGLFMYRQIDGLAERTRAVADAAASSSRAITDGAATLSGVPLVGNSIGGLLGRLGTLTGQTAGTLTTQADQFALEAPVVGLVIGLGGAALVVTGWWAGRGRWIRTASAVTGPLDRAELEVLAMSAVVRGGPGLLRRLGNDTAARWRAGDPATIRWLADAELRRLGLRPAGADSRSRPAPADDPRR